MQIRETKHNYLANNQEFSFKEKLGNGLKINAYIIFGADKFLDYQKDLIQDFLADFVDKANTDIYDETDIKNNLEEGLQTLNVNLRKFADKVSDVKRFDIKGYIQIIAGNLLMSSMIGDTSIAIFRNQKLYYQLHNGSTKRAKVDVFSDFVEGDIESGDELVYVGTKFSDVLDQSDIKDIESTLQDNQSDFIDFFEKLFTTRLEKENLGLLSNYYIHGNIVEHKTVKKNSKLPKGLKIKSNWTKKILANRYYVTISILSIVILFMLYNILSQLLNTSNQNIFTTASGVMLDITIDDIKKDILSFKQMDPASNHKGIKYSEILQKLDILENKGRRLEDVENLRGIIQDDYYKGFNILRIEDLTQLDDPATGIKTRVISFNDAEKSKMGEGLFVDYQRGLNIGGSQGALVGAVNDGSRGSLIEYNVEQNVAGCSTNLLRDGMYCYTKDGRIFSITKAGVEPLTTADPGGFSDTIGGLGVYGKANLYVMQPNLNSAFNSVFVTRYRNTVGSQVAYQEGQDYTLMPGYDSGHQFVGDFTSLSIDSTFLTWNNGKLFQLRRPGYGTNLDVREISLLGGDSITNKYSNNVKIISFLDSKYVYLFDREKGSFTVYTSNPLKTNDQYNTQYSLHYLFSFKFDLENETVLDISIPDSSGNRPEMYVLTDLGVNKINLYEYIDSIVNDETLKAINHETVE